MGYCLLISATEGIAVSPSHFAWDIWMTIFVAIVDVGATMVPQILSSAFNAIVKAAALNVVKLSWRAIPIASIPIMILTEFG
jgi:hypothetical protein